MTTMRERIARRLIDIDPCISGYHPLHLELKYPIIDAVLDELMQPSDVMTRLVRDEITKRSAYSVYPSDDVARRVFQSAIRAAKEER